MRDLEEKAHRADLPSARKGPLKRGTPGEKQAAHRGKFAVDRFVGTTTSDRALRRGVMRKTHWHHCRKVKHPSGCDCYELD
jgi:hypothetical protein